MSVLKSNQNICHEEIDQTPGTRAKKDKIMKLLHDLEVGNSNQQPGVKHAKLKIKMLRS